MVRIMGEFEDAVFIAPNVLMGCLMNNLILNYILYSTEWKGCFVWMKNIIIIYLIILKKPIHILTNIWGGVDIYP